MLKNGTFQKMILEFPAQNCVLWQKEKKRIWNFLQNYIISVEAQLLIQLLVLQY